MRRFVLLVAGLLLSLWAEGRSLDVAAQDAPAVALAGYFTVLEDAQHEWTLADVQSPALAARFVPEARPGPALSRGFTRSAYWLRLELRNGGDAPVRRLLELGYPLLSHVDLYAPGADGAYAVRATGAAMPFATRAYPSRTYVFPLELPAHATQALYLRVQATSAMLVPATLWQPQAFARHERGDYMAQAAYFGLAAALIAYNLLLWAALRDATFLSYSVFALLGSLTIAASNGWGHEFLWPGAPPWWSDTAVSVLGMLTQAALLLFMRRMLGTREGAPRLDRLARGFVAVQLAFAAGYLLWTRAFVVPSILLLQATCLFVLAAGLYCALVRRQRIAAFFVAAFCCWMGGVTLMGFKTLGLLPANLLTMNGLQIGTSLEMLSLAFALAWRFHMIRRQATEDVRQANAGLAQRLQAREAELTASHERLREVERRQTLAEERQRLMQDMHDGMGASLASALWGVERGQMGKDDMAGVLKGCIDDLKLAIDSMEPVEADLLLLLATLRYRLGPRLESTGIALRWEVQDVPALPWLDPRNALHILRILQEALANTIQHAGATEVRVSTAADAQAVTVSIADNGRGFDVHAARSGQGKGLSNQLRRAQAIGAQVAWESGPAGTRMALRLPQDFRPSAA